MAFKLFRLLFRIVGSAFDNASKQKFCTLVLKMHLAKYFRYVAIGRNSSSGAEICSTLKRIMQAMYRIRSDNKSGSPDKRGGDNEVVFVGVGLLQELLSFVWTNFASDFAVLMQVNISTNNDSNNTSNDNEEMQCMLRQSFFDMMDCVAYAAAILRNISTANELDRRRLVHAETVTCVADWLRTVETNKVVISVTKQQRKLSKLRNHMHDQSSSANSDLEKLFLEKLVQILTQLVVVVRNIALESHGKAVLLSTKTIVTLCNYQRMFRQYPELQLNCARVTAKLSLSEVFRQQINSSSAHVKNLVGVLMAEAEQCHIIMEGGNSSNNSASEEASKMLINRTNSMTEESAWPAWHTWPLLSRICFTLGNLTTTNDENR